jgi:hypothetical protein
MSKFSLSSLVLASIVAAPAVLAGRLARSGDLTRALQVALIELLVIAIACAISSQRSLD